MDWNDRLNRAEKAGIFTQKDRIMAGSWLTCAVGERAVTLNLNPEDDPSEAIEGLGLRFLDAVLSNRYLEARRLLSLIQRWGRGRLSV